MQVMQGHLVHSTDFIEEPGSTQACGWPDHGSAGLSHEIPHAIYHTERLRCVTALNVGFRKRFYQKHLSFLQKGASCGNTNLLGPVLICQHSSSRKTQNGRFVTFCCEIALLF